MLTPIAAVGLILVGLLLGIGIAEFYHYRIDKARQGEPQELWDLSPAPQPKILTTQDYARQKRAQGR